jgi:putative ABC transport system ATP-binding protein
MFVFSQFAANRPFVVEQTTARAGRILATELTKTFGEGETKVTAFKGGSFSAAFGEMLFIVGPSGSG